MSGARTWAIAGAAGLAAAATVAGLYAAMDAATATFFVFALALVCGLGAAPVVFGVVTRRRDERYNREVERVEGEDNGPRG